MRLRIPLLTFSGLLVWMLVSPGCMRFRTSDAKAIREFGELGLRLEPIRSRIGSSNLHGVSIGPDSLPALVFIHGTPGSWNAFDSFMKDSSLRRRFRMISIDRPGFGYSDFGKALPMKEQTSLMLSFLDSLRKGRRVFLAGHSLGGPIVLRMAAERPDAVDGIMLISGSVDPALEPREKWRYWMDVPPLRFLLPGAFRPSNTELVHFKKDILDLQEDFPKVVCDVHIVHGMLDKWVPPGNAEHARRMLRNAKRIEWVMIDKGNHFIPWTYHGIVAEAMLKMLEKSQKSSP
jgi:pimeloyl-ACP methyl ester carboxylesterase